jgi:hypothetical protein
MTEGLMNYDDAHSMLHKLLSLIYNRYEMNGNHGSQLFMAANNIGRPSWDIIKHKLGIKRERSLFVFTPQMAAVLGGPEGAAYAAFLEYGTRAYAALRRHSSLLVTLFSLMVGCGLPELQTAKEVEWLRAALRVDDSDEAAAEAWAGLVAQALRTRSRQIDDAVHMLVHS